MTETQNVVRVACAADRNFFRFVPTMINSVVSNTERRLEFGVFVQDVEPVYREKLKSLFPQVTFQFWEIEADLFKNLPFKLALSPMVYARALMADLSGWDDFVYLDLDIAVTGDVGELYDVDIGDSLIGSCIISGGINSGVLKLNGRAWREESVKDKVLKYAAEFQPKEADQASIEAVCQGRVYGLESKWNVVVDALWAPHTLEESYYGAAAITHYITGFKPWNLGYYLLPKTLKKRWKQYEIKAGFPVPWKKEATVLTYQVAMILKMKVLKRFTK